MWKQFWNILFPSKCVVCGDARENAVLCAKCRKLAVYRESKQLAIGFAYCGVFEYDTAAQRIIAAIKYQKNRELLPFIQKAFLENAPPAAVDIVVPVPLNPLRYQERGFNQAAEFVKLYAAYRHIPLRTDIVYRGRHTQKLAALSPESRKKETAAIFQVWANKRAELAGKKILIVDDIITTGSTVKNLAETLWQYGPESIEIFGVFRPRILSNSRTGQ